jgi:hypothetical protein
VLKALRAVLREWRYMARSTISGRRFDFPWCCQLHYYLDVLRGRTSGARRGGVMLGPRDVYVPCGICRRRPHRWRYPKVMDGPREPIIYKTWEQSCAECGIGPEVAARYVQ